MKDLREKLLPLTRKVWWFGPLSAGVTAVGLTNCVGLSLGLLLYLGTLAKFSLNLIFVIFGIVIGLFSNLLLLYGAAASKPHLLLPWLVITVAVLLALLVYTAVKWHELAQFKAVTVGAMMFSIYFCSVVVSFYHQLKRKTRQEEVVTGQVEEEGVGTPSQGGKVASKEETVLVLLDQETPSPPSKLPKPEAVITLPLASNNPFLGDIFKVKKAREGPDSELDIRTDFTPFKSNNCDADNAETEVSAKMRVFLPQNGDGEESDFDFSFNDPVFDSSLCAKSNHV